jgi:hypothetical protein
MGTAAFIIDPPAIHKTRPPRCNNLKGLDPSSHSLRAEKRSCYPPSSNTFTDPNNEEGIDKKPLNLLLEDFVILGLTNLGKQMRFGLGSWTYDLPL